MLNLILLLLVGQLMGRGSLAVVLHLMITHQVRSYGEWRLYLKVCRLLETNSILMAEACLVLVLTVH